MFVIDSLEKGDKNKLIEGLKTVYMKQNEFVFREGEEGEDFYIIEHGEVDCLKLQDLANKEKCFIKVRTLKGGDHFGELALINKQKRSLGIRVSSADGAKLHTLDKDTFTRILGEIDKYLKKDYDKQFDNKFEKMKEGKE